MTRGPALVALALALAPTRVAAAGDALAVVPVAEVPGPAPALAELARGLRDAFRDRAAGVVSAGALQERLAAGRPQLGELERACAEGRLALEAGDAEGAERRLRAAAAALERAPESAGTFALWTEATARLAWAQRVAGRPEDAAATLERLAARAPDLALDEVRYPPSLRAELTGARARVRPAAHLTVRAGGRPAAVFVDGRPVGVAPVTVALPAGRHRVAGVLRDRRLPPVVLELSAGARALELDAALAEAVRPQGGPGLAADPGERGALLARLGAWLGVHRLVTAAQVEEGGVAYLEATLHEPPAWAPRRAGRVRLAGGVASAAQLGALASFLLGGPGTAEVIPVERSGAPAAVASATAAPPAPPPAAAEPPEPQRQASAATSPAPALPDLRPAAAPAPLLPPATALAARAPAHPWARPAAYAAGGGALLLAGFTVWQALAARSAYGDADAMLLPDGTYVAGATAARRQQALADGAAASRNAYLGAAGTLALAGVTLLLGHLAADEHGVTVTTF